MARYPGYLTEEEQLKRRAKSSQDFKRRPAFRTVPDRILIVTEGSKTEPDYFRLLAAELGLTTAKIIIVGDGGSAPKSVVQETERILSRDSDFEKVYCVFDRDRHESYDQAIGMVRGLSERVAYRGKEIHPITSVPCFEFWYLLHVSDSRKPYENASSPADALIADLKRKRPFEEYSKGRCASFYSQISPMRQSAISRARAFLASARDEGSAEHHENPSTRVYLLVEALEGVARNGHS
ncbi:MAG: csm2 [Rhodobacteraceae bacterium]|nr:MAG: csm2 [Paracoccaceae bacterium]